MKNESRHAIWCTTLICAKTSHNEKFHIYIAQTNLMVNMWAAPHHSPSFSSSWKAFAIQLRCGEADLEAFLAFFLECKARGGEAEEGGRLLVCMAALHLFWYIKNVPILAIPVKMLFPVYSRTEFGGHDGSWAMWRRMVLFRTRVVRPLIHTCERYVSIKVCRLGTSQHCFQAVPDSWCLCSLFTCVKKSNCMQCLILFIMGRFLWNSN